MIKHIVLILTLVIAGCSVLFPPHKDETEYRTVVEIAAISSHGTCSADQTEKLADRSSFLNYYSLYLPNNDLFHQGAVELDKTVQSLNERAHPGSLDLPITQKYCELRLRVIHQMALSLAQASGGKVE